MDGWVLFRLLSANFVFVLPPGVKIYFYIYEGGIQMKNDKKGKCETMWPKGTGYSNAIRTGGRKCRWLCETQQSPELLWTKQGRRTDPYRHYGWLSTDSRYSKAAVTLCQKGILVQRKRVPCRWAVSFPDENVFTTDGKGICRSSWRKSMRCPRRLRVPSLNKIAQTEVRPSPLWEFRAANCFRDSIVA